MWTYTVAILTQTVRGEGVFIIPFVPCREGETNLSESEWTPVRGEARRVMMPGHAFTNPNKRAWVAWQTLISCHFRAASSGCCQFRLLLLLHQMRSFNDESVFKFEPQRISPLAMVKWLKCRQEQDIFLNDDDLTRFVFGLPPTLTLLLLSLSLSLSVSVSIAFI